MSLLIFLITIIGFAFIVWVIRKIMDLLRFRHNGSGGGSDAEGGGSTPDSNSSNSHGQPQPSNSSRSNGEYTQYKNPDGRRVLNAMLFMAQQYSGRGPGTRKYNKPPPPQSLRRASFRNGIVRVRNPGSPHRVVPSRVSYRPGHHPRDSNRPIPLLPMGENTVQIEVPIVVVLPPAPSTSNMPVTMLYDDPPPPFDEEPPPPYEEIFGPNYRHSTRNRWCTPTRGSEDCEH